MRAEARGESGTLMACTPSCASRRAPSISLVQLMPRGGTISTRVMNWPCSTREPILRALAQRRGRRFGRELDGCCALRHLGLRIHGAHRRTHGADVIRCRAAAAADDLSARRRWPCARSWPCTPASRDRCCGLRRRAACPRSAWQPGAAWWRRRIASRAVSTVEGPVEQLTPIAPAPHSVSSAAACCRRRSIEAVALIVHGDHHQHRQIGRRFQRGDQRFACFVERRHGFDRQACRRRFGQGADLFGKGRAGLVEASLAQRLKANAERSHRSGDPGFAGLLSRADVQLPGAPVRTPAALISADFCAKSMPRQAEPVRAEGVGLDNLRACLQILLVDGRESGSGRRGSVRRSSG